MDLKKSSKSKENDRKGKRRGGEGGNVDTRKHYISKVMIFEIIRKCTKKKNRVHIIYNTVKENILHLNRLNYHILVTPKNLKLIPNF